ncbi:hypothetical protein [Parasutterella secunda]|nr:hypothetical protein [Parasutterella secunda]MCR8920934.1 hypothetical protein [Parasutterella secunda]
MNLEVLLTKLLLAAMTGLERVKSEAMIIAMRWGGQMSHDFFLLEFQN